MQEEDQAAVRLRKRGNQPPLPSILLANVQSIENKLDEFRSRIAFQRDIKNCNVLILTETWLNPAIPDSAIVPDGFERGLPPGLHSQDSSGVGSTVRTPPLSSDDSDEHVFSPPPEGLI